MTILLFIVWDDLVSQIETTKGGRRCSGRKVLATRPRLVGLLDSAFEHYIDRTTASVVSNCSARFELSEQNPRYGIAGNGAMRHVPAGEVCKTLSGLISGSLAR